MVQLKKEEAKLSYRQFFCICPISDLLERGWTEKYSTLGYTEMVLEIDGRYETFRCAHTYHDRPWYD